ncbi:MAG: hypothetical protein H0T70_03510 [Acidimicrobiia bacterium]|nr:hypothetical protein [Acidimicrobiia bacterium]
MVMGNQVLDPVLARPAPSSPPNSPDPLSSDPTVVASSVGHTPSPVETGNVVEVVVDVGSVVLVVGDDVDVDEVGDSSTVVVG